MKKESTIKVRKKSNVNILIDATVDIGLNANSITPRIFARNI